MLQQSKIISMLGLLLMQHQLCQSKIISATVRWERIGATPHFLRNLCDPAFCKSNPCQTTGANGRQCFVNGPGCIDFNFEKNAGCSTYDHRTILYTVFPTSKPRFKDKRFVYPH
jgi:hypothetical protein